MSSVSSVGGTAASQYAQSTATKQAAQRAVDADHDGDNDAGVSKAQEASEQSASIRTASGGIDTLA